MPHRNLLNAVENQPTNRLNKLTSMCHER